MDRRRMVVALAVAAAAGLLAGCKKASPGSGKPTGGGKAGQGTPTTQQVALLRLLPDSGAAAGWERHGPAWSGLGADPLYDRIDGAAEAYLQYDFKCAAQQQYVKGGDEGNPIEVTVFQFASAAESFGAYSLIRGASKPIDLGNGAVYEAGTLELWQGPYFVRIVAVEHTEELFAAVEGLARAVSTAIGEKAPGLPGLFDLLPAEGRVAGREWYAHTGLSVERLRPGFMTKPLNLSLSQATELAAAEYAAADGGETNRVFLIRYPAADKAAAAYDAYMADQATRLGTVGRQTALLREGACIVGSWSRLVEAAHPLIPSVIQRIKEQAAGRP